MINWTLAKAGAIAVHRNGGRSVIREYKKVCKTAPYPHCVALQNYHLLGSYWTYDDIGEQGEGTGDDSGCPFDIIAIEPAPEPKRETVMLYWEPRLPNKTDWYKDENDTHRITFDTLDGEPVLDSVRMEKL